MSLFRSILNSSGAAVSYLFRDVEKQRSFEGVSDRDLERNISRTSISDFLFYRTYQQLDGGLGLYLMDDDSLGFVVRISPPPYLGEDIEETIANFFGKNFPIGTAIQFSTFASRNLKFLLAEYQQKHQCELNVKHPHMLKKLVSSRRRYIEKGVHRSLFKGQDFRVRNFINLISVKFPRGTDIEDIENVFAKTIGTFSKMGARNFPAADLIAMVQEILNPGRGNWDVFGAKGKTINKLCVGSDTLVKLDTKRKAYYLSAGSKERWTGKTISINTPSEYLSLFDFQSRFFSQLEQDGNAIPSPFFMQLTIVVDDRYKLSEKIYDKVKNNIENLQKAGKFALSNPALKDRFDEAREVALALKDGEFPLPAMWSLSVFERNPKRLDQIIDGVMSNFEKKQFRLQVEDHATISFQSLLYSLPLQYTKLTAEHLKRYDLLFKTNNAQICPALSDFQGYGDKITPLLGRTGQLQFLDLFSNKAGNALVIGGTGTGKSFTVSDIILNSQAAGQKCVIVDLGYNYQNLNELIGGQMIDFEPKSKLCMNFFTKAVCETDEASGAFILDEDGRKKLDKGELMSITMIIGMMMGINLRVAKEDKSVEDSARKKYLSALVQDSIQKAFKIEQHNTNLCDVYEQMKEAIEGIRVSEPSNAQILAQHWKALAPYAEKTGMHYEYFNGANNINFESDSLILELNNLKGNDDLFYVAYMAVMNFVAAEFFMDRTRRKLFIQEEAWAVLPVEIIALFLEDLYRRIRKYNGAVVIVTNSLSDFSHNVATKSMYENAPWKLFTEVDVSALEKAIDDKNIYLSDLEKEVMKSVKKTDEYSEIFVRTGSYFFVSRVAVDPYSKYLYANANKDTKEITEVVDKYGLNKQDAIYFLALREETGLSDVEILKNFEKTQAA